MIDLISSKKPQSDADNSLLLDDDRQSLPTNADGFGELMETYQTNPNGDPSELDASGNPVLSNDSSIAGLSEETTVDETEFAAILPQLDSREKPLTVSSGNVDATQDLEDEDITVSAQPQNLAGLGDSSPLADSESSGNLDGSGNPIIENDVTQPPIEDTRVDKELMPETSIPKEEDGYGFPIELSPFADESDDASDKDFHIAVNPLPNSPDQSIANQIESPTDKTKQVEVEQLVQNLEQKQAETKTIQESMQTVMTEDGITQSPAMPASQNTQSTSTSVNHSMTSTTTWSQGQQASSGQQSFSQSNQQQSPFNQPQTPVNEQVQKQQLASEQQTVLRTFNEAMAADVNTAEKTERILGDLGVGFDRRLALPTALQSINLPVRSAQWGQALGQRVVYMANNKMQEAKITLNPEKLGPVQIKIQIDKDQQINVAMTAQNGTTREALEQAIPRLREMLETAGIDFGSVDVSTEQDFDAHEFANDSANGQHPAQTTAEADEEEVMPIIQQSDNLVDYYA